MERVPAQECPALLVGPSLLYFSRSSRKKTVHSLHPPVGFPQLPANFLGFIGPVNLPAGEFNSPKIDFHSNGDIDLEASFANTEFAWLADNSPGLRPACPDASESGKSSLALLS